MYNYDDFYSLIDGGALISQQHPFLIYAGSGYSHGRQTQTGLTGLHIVIQTKLTGLHKHTRVRTAGSEG
jgi:hypothetical protein